MEIRGEAGGVVECGLRNIVDVVLQSLVRDPGNVNQMVIYGWNCRGDKQANIHCDGQLIPCAFSTLKRQEHASKTRLLTAQLQHFLPFSLRLLSKIRRQVNLVLDTLRIR